MAEFAYSKIESLVTPGGTITFNAAAADTLQLLPKSCRGLGGFEARGQIDPRGQSDGDLVGTFYLPGARITLGGHFKIVSAVTEAGYVAARDALMDATYAKAKSAAAASSSTLNFTGGASIAGLKIKVYDPHPLEGVAKGFLIDLVGTTLP